MMDQDIFCADCGRKLFTVDEENNVAYLRQLVEQRDRCECGSHAYVVGVRFL